MWKSLRSILRDPDRSQRHRSSRRRQSARAEPRWLNLEPLERRILLAGDVRVRYEFSEPGGAIVQSLEVGNDYRLSVHIQDIQSTPDGLLKAFLDINYPANLISINGPIAHGPSYNLGGTGDASTPGLIDEVGSLDTDTIPPASRGAEFLLFSVPFHADAVGTLSLTADPADTPTSFFQLFNLIEVPFVDIDFEGGSVEITGMANPVLSVARSRHGSEGGTGDGVFTVSQSTATASDTGRADRQRESVRRRPGC